MPTELLDLVDHGFVGQPGSAETLASRAIWGKADLDNVQHTLVISVGAGEPYGIVDGLMCVGLACSMNPTI